MGEHWELIAAAIALAAGLWSQVKSLFSWLHGLLVCRVFVDTKTAIIVSSYLHAVGKRGTGKPTYGLNENYIKPIKAERLVGYELLSKSGVFRRGYSILWLSEPGAKDEHEEYPFCFSFVRGTVRWEQLLLDALAWKESSNVADFSYVRHQIIYHYGKTLGAKEPKDDDPEFVYHWNKSNGMRPLGYAPEDIGGSADTSTTSLLALSPDLERLVEEIRYWHGSAAWYHEHNVTWRRGYLFHGVPGTGKTSMARGLAKELDLPVHVFDLASLSNEDLREAWSGMKMPCLALFEDIDAIFEGRKNVSASGELTYDALLNCIDGIERMDGILVVITTNHLEKVDSALVHRPGRIDRVVEFLPLDYQGRLKIAKQILGSDYAEVMTDKDMPAAQFVEECCRLALAKHFASLDQGPYRSAP